MPRTKTVVLRVTAGESAAMKKAARKSGLTLSEWIRRCCVATTITVTATQHPTGAGHGSS